MESETWDSAGSLKIMPGHKIGEIRSLFKKIEMSPEELMKKLDEIRREVEKERPDLLR